MPVNKVIFEDRVLIDLTEDTVDSTSLLKGITAHAKDGSLITGIFEPTSSAMDDVDRMLIYGLDGFMRLNNSMEFKAVTIRQLTDGSIIEEVIFEENKAYVLEIRPFENENLLKKALYLEMPDDETLLGERISALRAVTTVLENGTMHDVIHVNHRGIEYDEIITTIYEDERNENNVFVGKACVIKKTYQTS